VNDPAVAEILECVECGAVWLPADQERWQLHQFDRLVVLRPGRALWDAAQLRLEVSPPERQSERYGPGERLWIRRKSRRWLRREEERELVMRRRRA
jgi:hypothetical protein